MNRNRIHSLDALRSFLMLLGVYFHLSLAYTTFGDGDGWVRDLNSTSPVFDYFFNILHYFRMHAFFLVAGFFGSLLYHKRGGRKMIFNRFKRIFLPLIVFVGPLHILIEYFRKFSAVRNDGHNILDSLSISANMIIQVLAESPWELFPFTTLHLWFLNYLFFMSLLAYLLKSIISKYIKLHSLDDGNFISNAIRIMTSNLFLKPWMGTFIFCFFYGLFMMFLLKTAAQAGAAWWSWLWFFRWNATKTFMAFGIFYFIGWHMYHHKSLINLLGLKRQLSIFLTYSFFITGLMFSIYKIFPYSPYPQINYGWGSSKEVTFNVDMSGFDFRKFYQEGNQLEGVFIQGDFNGWCGECDNKMTDEDGDGIYTKTISVKNGDYNFAFTINGGEGLKRYKKSDFDEWISPGKVGFECEADSGFRNYKIQVFEEELILDPICWKQCTDCDGNIINLASYGKKEPLEENPINLIYLFLWNFGVPLYIMLVISISIRFFSTGSKIIRYVSDASYWVYIIHLPVTHFASGLFHGVSMNVFLKFFLSSIVTTLICFFSYHYLVRRNFIGKFLDGRKYN